MSKERYKEYQKRWRETHREKILEYQRRYRAKLYERLTDVELAEMARKRSEYNKVYREKNKRKLAQKNREWRRQHKREKALYDKVRWRTVDRNRRRERRLYTPLNGETIKIGGILKRPYPSSSQCELCGKELRLQYHHWDGTEKIVETINNHNHSDKKPLFVKGIWVCQPCNLFVHRLTEYPFLAKKWLELKQAIESAGKRDVESEIYG